MSGASEDTTVETGAANRADPALDAAGPPELDRYVVIREIGRGGMGVVLAAYDPRLQREVALKVVSTRRMADSAARLVREARAMAKLSDAHVVEVFDVHHTRDEKKAHDSVLIAMELVEGPTLRGWLKTDRKPELILEQFLQAGAGLVAAHRAGLLHRDFKPGNVLVGADGRTRVTDFGLARARTGPASGGAASSSGALWSDSRSGPWSESSSVDDPITRVGTVMGTPAYMAPEQHRGEELTEAVDQYAFCVALWEALAHRRPFKGSGRRLLKLKDAGAPEWPKDVRVSRRVVDAMRRGLAPDPDRRWPSMQTLLRQLDPVASRRRKLWPVVAISAAGMVGATSWLAASSDETQCMGADAQLAEVWNDQRREAGRKGFTDTGLAFAGGAWDRLQERLDAYGTQWVNVHRQTCEATAIHGTQSPEDLDLEMACLRRARAALDTLADVAATADRGIVERAHEIVRGLPRIADCDDVDALRSSTAPPAPEIRKEVEDIRSALARVMVLRTSGKYKEAYLLAERAVGESRRLGYLPLLTEALLELGHVEQKSEEQTQAEVTLREALRVGLASSHFIRAGWAASLLVAVVGYQQGDAARGLAYAGTARGLFGRGEGDADALSGLYNNVAVALDNAGKYAEAESEHLAALALAAHAFGDDDMAVASTYHNLAGVLYAQGRYEDAENALREAIRIRQRGLGEDHPRVADTHNSLGAVLRTRGDNEGAIAEHQRALSIRTQAFGPRHPLVAHSRNNMANAYFVLGKYELAEQEYRQAAIVFAETLGENHRDVAMAKSNIANTLYMEGRYAEAVEEQRAALDIRIDTFGADHVEVADSHNNLAVFLQAQDKLGSAEIHARSAVAIRERAVGPRHPGTAMARGTLANNLRAQGKFEAAYEEQREALEIRVAAFGEDHPDTAESLHNLGQVLWDLGRFEESEAEYRRAIDVRRRVLGEDHPETAKTRHSLGTRLVERGRARDARALLEPAWKVLQAETTAPQERADLAFALARALWPTVALRPRALSLARKARRLYRQRTEGDPGDEAKLETWLKQRE